MQEPTLEEMGHMLREFSSHAGQSPYKTPSGVLLISEFTICNLPHDIDATRVMRRALPDMEKTYPRAVAHTWDFRPSETEQGRYEIHFNFQNLVEEKAISKLMSGHMIREVRTCGYSLDEAGMFYRTIHSARPKAQDGRTPPAPQ